MTIVDGFYGSVWSCWRSSHNRAPQRSLQHKQKMANEELRIFLKNIKTKTGKLQALAKASLKKKFIKKNNR
jgi:hypothetical protein